jgi:hypothetical protein
MAGRGSWREILVPRHKLEESPFHSSFLAARARGEGSWRPFLVATLALTPALSRWERENSGQIVPLSGKIV